MPDPRNCRQVDPWQTTLRGLSSYTIPKIDVLISGTFRSQPAIEISFTGLGQRRRFWTCRTRLCSRCSVACPPGALITGTTAVPLLDAEHRLFYGGRRNQVDMRVAKILRFGRTRADVGFDLQNLFNTNYATAYSVTYAYRQPGDDG